MSSVYLLSRSFAQLDWQNWLLEKVEWDEKEWIPRQACIEVFVREGLLPFLRENGYFCKCAEQDVGQFLARYMFFGRIRHAVRNVDFTEEEYDYYYFHLNDAKWADFWNSWSLWPDLQGEHPRIREGIRYCIWTLLDMESSSAFDRLETANSDSEEEDGGGAGQRRSGDPYLTDAAAGYFSYP